MLEIWNILYSYASSAFGAILLLTIVVAVHEFGHFICAKYVGARVDIFSIGFGKALLKMHRSGTEYRIAWIPLGGYVKIYGQDPEELEKDEKPEPDKALCKKSLPARLLVFSGGPVFNLILAAFVFAFLNGVGNWQLPSQAMHVLQNSPAWKENLRAGDKIMSVDGMEVKTFKELTNKLSKKHGKKIQLKIQREGAILDSEVMVQEQKVIDVEGYGQWIPAGFLDGFLPVGRAPIVGVSVKKSIWALQSKDIIQKINETSIHSWEDVEQYFQTNIKNLPTEVQFTVLRNNKKMKLEKSNTDWIKPRNIPDSSDIHTLMQVLELHNAELFVGSVLKETPAERAGLQAGDRLLSLNGELLYGFENLQDIVETLGKKLKAQNPGANLLYKDAVKLSVQRNGEVQHLTLDLKGTETKDHLGEKSIQYAIGIASAGRMIWPKQENLILVRSPNPLSALWAGVLETTDYSVRTLVGIKKLLFGEMSSKAIGGPIMILSVASKSFSQSWRSFVKLIGLISIALGIFNLLPVPALDGGHIAFALIEGARGKPFSPETTEKVIKVGFSLLLLLIVFATYNDILRIFHF